MKKNKIYLTGLLASGLTLMSCINAAIIDPNISPVNSINVGGNGGTAKPTQSSSSASKGNELKQPSAAPTIKPIDHSADDTAPVVKESPTPDVPPASDSPAFSEQPDATNPTDLPLPTPTNSSQPADAQTGVGSLTTGISWEPPPADLFTTAAERNDIKRLKLTVTGEAILRLLGKPLTKDFTLKQNQTTVKNIPPGLVQVELEAFDANDQLIGYAQVSNVLITARKNSRVNMKLQLSDTVVDESTTIPGGQLTVDIAIADGKKIVRNTAVVPKGGYLNFDDVPPTPPTKCAGGVPDLSAAPSTPTFDFSTDAPILPDLDLSKLLADIAGSSAGSDPIFAGMGSESDLTGASVSSPCNGEQLVGASVSTPVPRPVTLQQLGFRSPFFPIKTGGNLDLKPLLTARLNNGTNQGTGLTWKSSNPSIASVDSNGLVKASQVGQSTISVMATAYGKQATTLMIVKDTIATSKPFIQPTGQLLLSASRLKPGGKLFLQAQQVQGSVSRFSWLVSDNQLKAETLRPSTELVTFKPGRYSVSLYLMGTNGKFYPAANSPQSMVVAP